MADTDRAVVALRESLYDPIDWRNGVGQEKTVALILRVVRDDIVLAYQMGRIRSVEDVERALNARITALTGEATTTGDTTNTNFPCLPGREGVIPMAMTKATYETAIRNELDSLALTVHKLTNGAGCDRANALEALTNIEETVKNARWTIIGLPTPAEDE
jgi:hypothetical protein